MNVQLQQSVRYYFQDDGESCRDVMRRDINTINLESAKNCLNYIWSTSLKQEHYHRVPGIVLKKKHSEIFHKIHRKTSATEFPFFERKAGLKSTRLLEKRSQQSCFTGNFAKFFIALFYRTIQRTASLLYVNLRETLEIRGVE